jgi:hypothetical protein
MIERIRLWWKFDGRYYHKNFANGVKNLWKWFPVIWEDRDWDQHYIYKILKTKLEFQAQHIHKNGFHTEAERDAEKMFLCARLIQIQIEDLYGTEHLDYHDVEYEFVPTDETKQWFEIKDTTHSESYDEYFAKYPRQYKKVLNGGDALSKYLEKDDIMDSNDKRRIAMFVAHENQERSRKLLFKILEENIESWWD